MARRSNDFEKAFQQLEQIVQRLEKGELALEESLVLYEEGVRLSRVCHAKLEEAEGKIEILLKDQRGGVLKDRDGNPRTQPFAPSSQGSPGQTKPEGDASS
jgi:exodeoxyribonuclease VII small subunit